MTQPTQMPPSTKQRTRRRAAEATPDCGAIMQSIGEAAYEWCIASDALVWSGNAPALLGLRSELPISSGRAFAKLLDPSNARTRFDAVVHAAEADSGAGGGASPTPAQ